MKTSSRRLPSPLIVLLAAFATAGSAPGQAPSGADYPDGHGGKVHFPLGERSFADEVVSFDSGRPAARRPADRDPRQAMGIPDYDSRRRAGSVTLGCGGELTLRFVDNALVDVPGPDLYVFEVGPDIEPTDLSISEDGKEWIRVGGISGGRADVDIAASVRPGQIFHYVRLTDLKRACGGATPGADIDAVGAIGSALLISLDSAVLFDFEKYALKADAQGALDKVVAQIQAYPGASVAVAGHTDAVGTAAVNQKLSENRAGAVRDYLRGHGLAQTRFETRGYGAARPVAGNDTDEGRARNRRVEIVITPAAAAAPR